MNGEVGLGVKVGGGLSTKPYFSQDLGVFINFKEIMPVVHAVSEIFRDADVLRQNRGMARLKYLMNDQKIGIGPDAFREQIEAKLGYAMRKGVPDPAPVDSETDHLGVFKQKGDNDLYYVGIGVRVGRLSGDKLLAIADVMDEFSERKLIRLTNKQNFIISDIPGSKLEALKVKLDSLGLDYRPSMFKKGLISCTGTEFCNLAVTETKEVGRRVSRELEERFPGATKKIRIHFSGCPNNCGQNAIADIGLRGMKTKGPEGVMVEAFDILVGGGTGSGRAFSEVCTKKFPSAQIAVAIGNLYEDYTKWCTNGQIFRDYVGAHSKEELDAIARGLPKPEPAPPQPGV
jgi:sulfite reductase beta subunit-like hemoprotein